MKRTILLSIVACLFISSIASADTFAVGTANEFEIDFVTISGDASSANGTYIGSDRAEGFIAPGYDYRMGTYEITNDQWDKFVNIYGTVNGGPWTAYNDDSYWEGANMPTNNVSWYEAAQFVNWLNTSTGHHVAYKFNGIQGERDYVLSSWDVTDPGYDVSNPFRNINAYYFLPTEDEWVKAAYWDGINLQTWATINDVMPLEGEDTNYYGAIGQPWNVGSGNEELNGTYDMMGNVWEWTENPYKNENYVFGAYICIRGGQYRNIQSYLFPTSSYRGNYNPSYESEVVGFRVASVPEPYTLSLLALGAMLLKRKS